MLILLLIHHHEPHQVYTFSFHIAKDCLGHKYLDAEGDGSQEADQVHNSSLARDVASVDLCLLTLLHRVDEPDAQGEKEDKTWPENSGQSN